MYIMDTISGVSNVQSQIKVNRYKWCLWAGKYTDEKHHHELVHLGLGVKLKVSWFEL